MKKIAIIILLAITSFSYAQEQEYDTIVYFPQTIFECPMLFDPVYSPIYYDFSDEYAAAVAATGNQYTEYYHAYFHDFSKISLHNQCDTAWANVDQDYLSTFSMNFLVGFKTMPDVRCFAQPYQLSDLDTAARVIGVAAKVFGHPAPNNGVQLFRLCDNNGNYLDHAIIWHLPDPSMSSGAEPFGVNLYPTTLDYYLFNNQHQIQAFSLIYDKNSVSYNHDYAGNVPYQFDHTMSIIGGDVNAKPWEKCKYEDLGCYEYLPPLYYKYGDTAWVSFDQDQYYQFYYKKQIGFFPIIIIPKTESDLSAEELAEHCNLVPNPATRYSKAISRYKIERLEIYDIQGKKMQEIAVNDYEYYINLQNYPKGTYLVNIVTQKGTTSKKLIKQ